MPDYHEMARQGSEILVGQIEAHKPDMIAQAPPLTHWVARKVINCAESHVPEWVDHILGWIGHTLGEMTINDVIDALNQMRTKSSYHPMPSIAAQGVADEEIHEDLFGRE